MAKERLAILTDPEVLQILNDPENAFNKARALIAGHCGRVEQESQQKALTPIQLRRLEIETAQKIGILMGADRTAKDLALMIRRMCWLIDKQTGDSSLKALAGNAQQLLVRHGLAGSPLRTASIHHKCKRCDEEIENGMEPDGCRDPDCPEMRPT